MTFICFNRTMEVSGRRREDTISNSSAEDFNTSCQPCLFEGSHIAAEGLCQTCNEYLCKTCLGVHRKQSATRNHVVLGKHQMPKEQPKSRNICSRPCNIHVQEIIKFFCESHDVVGCGDCMVLDHKKCKVELISDVSNVLKQIQSETKEEIQKFQKELEKSMSVLQSTQHDVEKNYSEVTKDIQTFRKEINKYLDQMEAELISQLNKAKQEATKVIAELMKKSQTMKTDLGSLVQEIDSQRDESNNLFVSLKLAKEKLSYMNMSHARLCEENKVHLLEFKRNEDMNRLQADKISLGVLKMYKEMNKRQLTVPASSSQTEENITQMTAVYAGKIEVKNEASNFDPKISGMTLLTAKDLVAVDNRQDDVKLFMLPENVIKYVLPLKARPFDVTSVNENRVAVTIPSKNLVCLISARNGVLKEERDISVNGTCYGIAHYSDGFVVSFLHPGKVELIDMRGKVLKSIVSDSSGQSLFQSPQYVDICHSTHVIYVSDSKRQDVISVTPEGEVVGLFKEKVWPQGLCALNDRKYLVAMYVGDISVISSEGIKLSTAVRPSNELKWMWALCYSYEHRKIFVSSENGRYINIYQFQ